MTDIARMTAVEAASLIRKKEVRSVELVEAVAEARDSRDEEIGAYLSMDVESALERARSIDDKISSGEQVGSLAGVPIAIKDNICVSGQPATCASRILEPFVPPYSATVIRKLLEEDAVLLGKTNMDEFAMGSSCENSAFHTTRNPWDTTRVPGGSSGGSAAAVSAGEAIAALGSDTGGSIRQPASFCGLVGLKPTYGRVSRYGLIAFASSLDQIGPLTKDVADSALILKVIAGHDPMDSTCTNEAVPDFLQQIENGDVGNMTLGVPEEYFSEGLSPEIERSVRTTIARLEERGAAVREISLPHTDYAVAVYYVVANAEASSNLARYDGVQYGFRAGEFENMIDMYSETRRQGFGDEVKRRVMMGTFVLSSGYYDAYFLRAQKVRRLIKNDFEQVFDDGIDCIVCPTTPTPAFALGEKTDDPLTMYLSDIFTISANLAGIPAVSVPCGFTDGCLPIGVQIMGRAFGETEILTVARAVEEDTRKATEDR
jgi:aspartyl-tRNA(Asn)/glutamyl-tRNA(Gln) amidotransferase subunit A